MDIQTAIASGFAVNLLTLLCSLLLGGLALGLMRLKPLRRESR